MANEQAGQPKPSERSPRRAWEPPAIAWEEDFTPYAFSMCGKMMGQGGACVSNRMS
jgi:hypothetical protein